MRDFVLQAAFGPILMMQADCASERKHEQYPLTGTTHAEQTKELLIPESKPVPSSRFSEVSWDCKGTWVY